MEEVDKNCNLQKRNTIFETYELPQVIYEVSDMNNASDDLVKATISHDIITLRTGLKTNNTLRFDKKYIFFPNQC